VAPTRPKLAKRGRRKSLLKEEEEEEDIFSDGV
jgi:hypothetical protein